jgi:hypothetical protein
MIFYSQDEFRKISTGLLYLLMTGFNIVHLCCLALEFVRLYDITIYAGTIFQCGFNSFVQNVTRATSIYLAVSVALDRLIRSEWPMYSRSICTRRNVLLVTGLLVLVFSAMWSFYLYQMSFFDPISGRCINIPASFTYFTRYIHDTARAIVVCVLPIVMIIAANVRLSFNIRSSRRRVHGTALSTVFTTAVTFPDQQQTNKVGRGTAFDRMILYMMLTNVLALFLTQTPFHIDQIRNNYFNPLSTFVNRLLRSFLLIWSSLYFGIGFYLYCLSAPLFRRKCRSFLSCRRETNRSSRNVVSRR